MDYRKFSHKLFKHSELKKMQKYKMKIKVEKKKMYFVSSPKTCKNLNSKHINSYVKLSDHRHTILMTYNVSTKSVALINEKKMSLELTASKLLLINKQNKHSKCI
jgi:hypothetical protein